MRSLKEEREKGAMAKCSKQGKLSSKVVVEIGRNGEKFVIFFVTVVEDCFHLFLFLIMFIIFMLNLFLS